MATAALRRLMAEFKQFRDNPPDGLMAGPVSEDNFFEWEAAVTGPEDCPFEDGVFVARISFPRDYPLNPPRMKFTSQIFHPNIYPDGRVCISILHAPGDDPFGYEKSSERWSPVQSVQSVLLSVMSMLAEPNLESPANVDAATVYRDDMRKFKKIAHRHVRMTLGEDPPADGEEGADSKGLPSLTPASSSPPPGGGGGNQPPQPPPQPPPSSGAAAAAAADGGGATTAAAASSSSSS